MRPPESFLGQPIRDLQAMLRVISRAAGNSGSLIPDGIYTPATSQAVADFQRNHGLPVTGITDLATWEAVYRAYIPAKTGISPACPLHILLNANEVIENGKSHPHLYLVQAMLTVLSKRFPVIPQPGSSGNLDRPTCEALKAFQGLCRLQVTGDLDKITWKHLALQYPLAAALLAHAPCRKS